MTSVMWNVLAHVNKRGDWNMFVDEGECEKWLKQPGEKALLKSEEENSGWLMEGLSAMIAAAIQWSQMNPTEGKGTGLWGRIH